MIFMVLYIKTGHAISGEVVEAKKADAEKKNPANRSKREPVMS